MTSLHAYQGDLKVDLLAPNSTTFNLRTRTGECTGNLIQTFTMNALAVVADGTWKLRVDDNASVGTDRIEKRSL